MVLQVGHGIIMADIMVQAGALQPDIITTVAYYGDEQLNRYYMTGAGHTGGASGTQCYNGRQDGLSRCTVT
jgi:hypothetical protein